MPAVLRKSQKDIDSCPNSPAIEISQLSDDIIVSDNYKVIASDNGIASKNVISGNNVIEIDNGTESNNAISVIKVDSNSSNNSINSTVAEDDVIYESPLQQIRSLIEKKIRNLEKRKSKLEQTKMNLQAGKELVDDQLKALKQLDCVESQIELAKEFLKNVKQIMHESEIRHKRNAKKADAAKECDKDVAKIRQLLIMQEVLDCLGKNSIRQDFRTGNKGAIKLTNEQFDMLDEAYSKLCPSREDLPNKNSWLLLLEESAKYSSMLLNSSRNSLPGRNITFTELRRLIDEILECEYFVHGLIMEPILANGNEIQHGINSTINLTTGTSNIVSGSTADKGYGSATGTAFQSATTTTNSTDCHTSPVTDEGDSSPCVAQLEALSHNQNGVIHANSASHRASSSSLSSAMTVSAAGDCGGPVSPLASAAPATVADFPANLIAASSTMQPPLPFSVPQQTPLIAYCPTELMNQPPPPPPPACISPASYAENGYYAATAATPAPVPTPAAIAASSTGELYESPPDGSVYSLQPAYASTAVNNQPISVCSPPMQEPVTFIYDPNAPFVTVSTAPLYEDGSTLYYNDYHAAASIEPAYFLPPPQPEPGHVTSRPCFDPHYFQGHHAVHAAPPPPFNHQQHHNVIQTSKSLDPNAPAFVSRVNTNITLTQQQPNLLGDSSCSSMTDRMVLQSNTGENTVLQGSIIHTDMSVEKITAGGPWVRAMSNYVENTAAAVLSNQHQEGAENSIITSETVVSLPLTVSAAYSATVIATTVKEPFDFPTDPSKTNCIERTHSRPNSFNSQQQYLPITYASPHLRNCKIDNQEPSIVLYT